MLIFDTTSEQRFGAQQVLNPGTGQWETQSLTYTRWTVRAYDDLGDIQSLVFCQVAKPTQEQVDAASTPVSTDPETVLRRLRWIDELARHRANILELRTALAVPTLGTVTLARINSELVRLGQLVP